MKIFYKDQMAPTDMPGNYSKSPSKPRRFLDFLRHTPVWEHVQVSDDFVPMPRNQLLLAHTTRYVDAFLSGESRLASSSGLNWSMEFRDSVLLTNSCLLTALREAIDGPAPNLTMAPVSGFHHAGPEAGEGFCTFSGQVIAALVLYQERGLRGAWLDLDGHFGNSIEDSRDFAPDLNQAIPQGCNINPRGEGKTYLIDLAKKLEMLTELVVSNRIDYVCVAHGADSHEWDQLGSQLTTSEWLEASDLIYEGIVAMRQVRPTLPVTMALFGGYRDDHPESVLGLHAMDLAKALYHLVGIERLGSYRAEVRSVSDAS